VKVAKAQKGKRDRAASSAQFLKAGCVSEDPAIPEANFECGYCSFHGTHPEQELILSTRAWRYFVDMRQTHHEAR
jgi:hypothetical protein